MLHKIFSIYDSTSEVYSQPFFSINRGTAVRVIQQVLSDSSTSISQYPTDYFLYEIGNFCDISGQIISTEPENLGCLKDYLKL